MVHRSTSTSSCAARRPRTDERPTRHLLHRPAARPRPRRAGVAREGRLRPVDRPATAAHLQRGAARRARRHRGRQRADLRGRPLRGTGPRPAPRRHRLDAGRPHERRRRRRDRAGHPGAAGPGAQRRRRGRARRGDAAGRHPAPPRGGPRRAPGPGLRRRHHPVPALPGVAAVRADGGAGRARRRGPCSQVAAGGAGDARRSRPTPSPPTPRTASTTCSRRPTSCRCTRRSRRTRCA